MPSAALLFLLAWHDPPAAAADAAGPGDAARAALLTRAPDEDSAASPAKDETADALRRVGAWGARLLPEPGARLDFRDDESLPSPLAFLPLPLDSFGLTWQPQSEAGVRPFADLSVFTDHEGTLLPGMQTWAGIHADLDARTTLGLSASHATMADRSPWPSMGTSALLSISVRF